MLTREHTMVFIPSLDDFMDWESEEWFSLTPEQQEEAVWMSWDEEIGEWVE